jgi:hypothetical protein
MRKEDKYMIKSYWLAKKNLKMATVLKETLENPCF